LDTDEKWLIAKLLNAIIIFINIFNCPKRYKKVSQNYMITPAMNVNSRQNRLISVPFLWNNKQHWSILSSLLGSSIEQFSIISLA